MATEVVQFFGMMVLLVGILLGSYWFVYSPTRRAERQRRERQEGSQD